MIEPPADQLVCACGQHKVVIGEETHEFLERVPASFCVVERARLRYACPKGCEAAIVCAPAPAAPIEKGRAGAGLLAWVVTSKYADHLPLNRIS